MKNLVIFHMESLNNLIFKMNESSFPNINKFLTESTYYSNYYTTATSTLMVISDLFYGRTDQFESSTYLEDIYSIKPTAESFFDKLFNMGYNVKNYSVGNTIDFGKNGVEGYTRAISQKSDYYHAKTSIDLIKDLDSFLSSENPFMFFVRDDESHISEMHNFQTSEISSNYDLYTERYKKMDETFGNIVNFLKQKGKFEETVFVLYGDHGEELWGHHLYEGYVHAFEPYVNLCSCPLIIHDAGQKSYELEDNLVSTINISEIVLALLKNVSYNKKNNYVFSRNLFSKQKLCLNRFNKSYCVTDGKYLLLVSNEGLEMYMNKIDPAGNRNILDFFKINIAGNVFYDKTFKVLAASHYRYFMTDIYIKELIAEYEDLRIALESYLESLYGNVKKSKMNFCRIRYSIDSRKKRRMLKSRYSKFYCRMLVIKCAKKILRKG